MVIAIIATFFAKAIITISGFSLSDNRDYCDYRDYHLYEIDPDNPWSFAETCFAKHLAKQEGRFACFAVF